MKRKNLLLALGTGLALSAGLFLAPGIGNASLTIMPLRVVFEDRDRNFDMTLANSSATTNTYRIEWTYNRMTELGTYEKSATPINPGLDFATAVVFSPRQVTIAPDNRQNVRLALRRPADLPEGEYRAHLNFKKLAGSRPDQQTAGSSSDKTPGVAMKLGVNVGFSVPVIVRVGAYDAQASLSDIQILPPAQPGQPNRLSMAINRTGKHSITGRAVVFWTPPGGKEEQIGILNNINIFTEINRRLINITLTNTQPLNAGTLRVVYEGIDRERGTKWAELSLPIQ